MNPRRRAPAKPHRWTGVAPVREDEPRAGWYRRRLVKGGPWCPVRIWFGPSFDPATGEWCDRSHCWRATINGDQVPVETVWPWCAGEPITEPEHEYLVALHRHAVAHEPTLPEASPRAAVNIRELSLPF